MDNRGLTYKYWIEFDENGEIKAFHKSKYDCENSCNEYIVKLIPIKRNVTEEFEKSADKLTKTIDKTTKIFNTEFSKLLKDLKGVLK